MNSPEHRNLGKTLPYLWSFLAVTLATLAGLALTSQVRLRNVSMIFLLAVLYSATRFGFGPALFSSVLSFVAYNFFFIEPLHTLSVTEPHEVLALFVLLAAAIVTSTIAGRVREQARRAAERDRTSRRLYKFARDLSALADRDIVADHAARRVGEILHRSCAIMLTKDGRLTPSAVWPSDIELEPQLAVAAEIAMSGGPAIGTGQPPKDEGGTWFFLPLRAASGVIGAFGIARTGDAPLDAADLTLSETMAELTATALERARLAGEITDARMATETERMRNTLLASISHDFRTPLASILGAATSLIEYGGRLPEPARRDLLDQVKAEAEHLDGMVRNLLSITRLEAGALDFHPDWIDLRELFDRSVATARRRGATQSFQVSVENDLPFVRADPNLMNQALSNVVGNAVQYSGPGAHIVLAAKREVDVVVLSVTDDGPGISAEALPRVFEKFSRAAPPSGEATGLGLAIVKGIAGAHQGSVAAISPVRQGRGTRIEIRLPLPKDAP